MHWMFKRKKNCVCMSMSTTLCVLWCSIVLRKWGHNRQYCISAMFWTLPFLFPSLTLLLVFSVAQFRWSRRRRSRRWGVDSKIARSKSMVDISQTVTDTAWSFPLFWKGFFNLPCYAFLFTVMYWSKVLPSSPTPTGYGPWPDLTLQKSSVLEHVQCTFRTGCCSNVTSVP